MKGFVIYQVGQAPDTETPVIVILSSRRGFSAADAIRKFAKALGYTVDKLLYPPLITEWAEASIVSPTSGPEKIRAQEVTFITVE